MKATVTWTTYPCFDFSLGLLGHIIYRSCTASYELGRKIHEAEMGVSNDSLQAAVQGGQPGFHVHIAYT